MQDDINQLQRQRPQTLIITKDFNCRSSQCWVADVESPEWTALDEIIETNNLSQLIDETTNIRGEGMSCIDRIITDKANLFVESGVHSSLDNRCQHQIIYGKLNISVPSPPPYKKLFGITQKLIQSQSSIRLMRLTGALVLVGLDRRELRKFSPTT